MIGLAAAVGALLIGVGPGQPIGPEAFGQHVAGLATAAPTSLTLTSVRLWDTGVRWDEIEKTRDRYDWATLDAAVANAIRRIENAVAVLSHESVPENIWDSTEQIRLQQAQEEQEKRDREAQAELRRKVDEILVVVNAASEGDLTKPLRVEGNDAVGELANGLRKMTTDLRGVFKGVLAEHLRVPNAAIERDLGS